MYKFSPVVLFTYNRPLHTQKTLFALAKNKWAQESSLIVYSDAPQKESDVPRVKEVRDFVKSAEGFLDIQLIERASNIGLAKNVISGVTEVIGQYKQIIVLEDDLVTSPYFLTFMNEALRYYQEERKVWHISAWNYPIATDGLDDVFFWRLMNCWGWATWADRWQFFEKDAEKLIAEFDQNSIQQFDLELTNSHFWSQVLLNAEGKINTWAVFWYATIFSQNGLCLNPAIGYNIQNIGHDGSGVHGSQEKETYSLSLNSRSSVRFHKNFIENELAVQRIQDFYRHLTPSLWWRIFRKLYRMLIA